MSGDTSRSVPWTPEDKERALLMLAAGYTASQVAAQFKGRSKASVLGLKHRASGQKRIWRGAAPSISRRKPGKPATGKAPIKGGDVEAAIRAGEYYKPQGVKTLAIVGQPIEALIDGRCKFPINDGGPFLFCAAVIADRTESPTTRHYCAHHREIVVGKAATKSERMKASEDARRRSAAAKRWA